MSLRVHFARHGESTFSVEHRFCGRLECPLTASGRRMGALLADRCAAAGDWKAIYSSPQRRARDTAEPASQRLGLPIEIEAGLREIDHGVWEGRTEAEVMVDDLEAFRAWEAHPGLVSAPGGESGYAVAARALPALDRIMTAWDDGDVLVVSHKATIRILACVLLGIDIDLYRARLALPVGSVTVFELEARVGPKLERYADVSHLPATLHRTTRG